MEKKNILNIKNILRDFSGLRKPEGTIHSVRNWCSYSAR